MDEATISELLDRLLGSDEEDVESTFELLNEFFRGAPIDRLRPLLRSENVCAVRAAVFIASELASAARSIREDIAAATEWNDRQIRCDAIDALLMTTNDSDVEILAALLSFARDRDPAVRWTLADFLAKATPGQIAAAAVGSLHGQDQDLADWLNGLVQQGQIVDVDELEKMLNSSDASVRAFAWAAYDRFGCLNSSLQRTLRNNSFQDIQEWQKVLDAQD